MMSRKTTEIDGPIGARIRDRRVLSRVTQNEMDLALGVSAQQVQKYENGKSRIGAARLLVLARFLNANASEFFEGLENLGKDLESTDDEALLRQRFILTREGIRLITGYLAIKDRRVRMAVIRLLESKR